MKIPSLYWISLRLVQGPVFAGCFRLSVVADLDLRFSCCSLYSKGFAEQSCSVSTVIGDMYHCSDGVNQVRIPNIEAPGLAKNISTHAAKLERVF